MFARHSRALEELSARLADAVAPRDVALLALEHAIQALGAQSGAVGLYDEGANALRLISGLHRSSGVADFGVQLSVESTVPIAQAVHRQSPVFAASPDEISRCLDGVPFDTLRGVQALAAVPAVAGGRVRAAIEIAWDHPHRCDEDERRLVAAIASQCAQALERARLHEDAGAAHRAKAEFLATMSHELRTPLAAILGYVELVADEVVGPVTALQRDHLLHATESAERLLALIEEVLSVSRLGRGKEPVRAERFSVVPMLEDLIGVVAPLAEKKGLPLRVEHGPVSLELVTDREKVRQILLNLLANAVKFTKRGEVVLSTGVVGVHAVFAVADTGPGIAPDDMEHVFDPFWQVQRGYDRAHGGAGLGLSAARALARLLGGDVTGRSVPGVGSTFTAYVPLEREDAPAHSDGANTARTGDRRRGSSPGVIPGVSPGIRRVVRVRCAASENPERCAASEMLAPRRRTPGDMG